MNVGPAQVRQPAAWIISPLADTTLLVATPLAIVPIVGLAVQQFSPELIFAAVAAFASIGHHLPGFLRTYGDRELFRRFRWRFLLAPPLILAVAVYFSLRSLHGLELIVLAWATWHIIMQTYGLMRIYDVKRGIRDAAAARWDLVACLAVFFAGIVFSQTRLYSILDAVGRVGMPLGPPETIAVLRALVGIAIGAVLVGYAIRVWAQTRAEGPSWIKIALLLTTGWLYWSCGSVSTNLLIGIAMFEIFHAAQYYAIVWSFNRRLADRDNRRLGWLRYMFGKGWFPLMLYAAAIIAFGSIKWFTDASDASTTKTILLAILLTSTTLHFYYDGFIWKVRERSTQENLGIENDGQRAAAVPGSLHAAKWAGLATLAALLFWIEASAPARTPDDERKWVASLAAWTPDAPELLVRQSKLALLQGDTTEAVRAAERALELRPASAEAAEVLGSSLLNAGRYEAAAAALRQAVALEPDVTANHYDLAQTLSHLERWDEAEQHFEIAARQQPKNVEVQKAWANMLVRRGAPDAAVPHFRAALALAPESLDIRSLLVKHLFNQGNALFLNQQNNEAENCFRESIELAPELAIAHGNLGAVLIRLNRLDDAKQELLKAVALMPENAQSHCNLGYVLLMEGNVDQARTHLLRAEALGQTLPPELRQAAGL
jgi:Flp pilus assembly protein TadD